MEIKLYIFDISDHFQLAPPTLSHHLALTRGQEAEECSGHGEPQRPRLAGPAAAAHRAAQVEASQRSGELQREHQLLPDGTTHTTEGEEAELTRRPLRRASKLQSGQLSRTERRRVLDLGR